MFISSHFSLNCIFDKMQPGVEDQLIKLLIETQKHDPVKMFPFDIQTSVRKGVLLKYCALVPGIAYLRRQNSESQKAKTFRIARFLSQKFSG